MKKAIMATLLAVSFVLTSCNSVRSSETVISKEESTTVETTEITTTTIETTKADKPEDFANVYCEDTIDKQGGDIKVFASDFNFVNATLTIDDNGVYLNPNYPAGQDIVVTFSSEKVFKGITLYRTPYPESFYNARLIKYLIRYDRNKPDKNTISNYLTYTDGVYTLSIPKKLVEQGYTYKVELITEDLLSLYFSVCCVNEETFRKTPTFSIDEHAWIDGSKKKFNSFKFINAKLSVVHDKHGYYPEFPSFPVGKDIKITFKSKEKLKIQEIRYSDSVNPMLPSKGGVLKLGKKALVYSKGKYTLTIPAKYVVAKRQFEAMFYGGENYLSFYFKVD